MSEIRTKTEKQKAAEAEVQSVREELGPFVVAAEETRMAMLFTDATQPGNPIIFCNDSFLALTGYDRSEVLGQSFDFLLANAEDQEGLARIEAEFGGNSKSGSEVRYARRDGSELWVVVLISPVRDEKGDIVQYFASFVDLSEHKENQERSKRLIDELNHRVKNTLSTVQAIVWQALRAASDPVVIREYIESRLFALSRSHDLLTRESWESAGLIAVIHDALEPFIVADGRTERIRIVGEDIRFPPRSILALGIAFHELATNAVKYGALSNRTGSILIEWSVQPGPEGTTLNLSWKESDGPPVTAPTRKGFGSRVIEQGLANELEGTVKLDYRSAGLVCEMVIPAPGQRDE